jgi:hypothetical protein
VSLRFSEQQLELTMEAYNTWFSEFQQALQDDKYDTLKALVLTAVGFVSLYPNFDSRVIELR